MEKLKERLDEVETEHKKVEEELGGKRSDLQEINIQLNVYKTIIFSKSRSSYHALIGNLT